MISTYSKPTPTEILDLAHDLQDDSRERDALWDRLDAIYDQTPPAESADVKLVVMPFGTNAIDLVTDLAAQQTLTIQVPAQKETQAAQKQADLQESWLRTWLNLNQQRKNANFAADLAWHGAQRGLTVVRTLLADNLIQPGEDGGYSLRSVPVLLQVRDPRHVYWVEDALGPACVIETYKRKASEIKRLYPGMLKDDAKGLVDWLEYWDDKHRAYFVNGELVTGKVKGMVAHGYGCLPYTIAPARTTPRRKPDQRYRPLLLAVEELLANLDTWFSILATSGWQAVTAAWAVFSDEYGRDGGKLLATGPGDINYFAKLDQVQPIQRAPLPADFFKLGDLFLTALQQGTFPFAMYGQLDSSMAGYAINLLTQSGRRPILPIWKSIELAFAGAFRSCALICRNKVAPLTGDAIPLMVMQGGEAGARANLRHIKLDTGSIGDDFEALVTLTDPMPQDEAANLRMALESTAGDAPLLSHQTALTKFNVVEDAAAELERVEAEKVFRQLAPFEAIKIAIERGLLPSQLKLPPGFVVGPNGQILPESALPKPEPQPQQPPAPEGMQGLAQPQLPPELMQAMMQGQPTPGAPNAADLQGISGQPPPVTLDEMAGMPPEGMPYG